MKKLAKLILKSIILWTRHEDAFCFFVFQNENKRIVHKRVLLDENVRKCEQVLNQEDLFSHIQWPQLNWIKSAGYRNMIQLVPV